MCRIIERAFLIALMFSVNAGYGQSLADVARQNRVQKEQNMAKAARVITTDDLSPTPAASPGSGKTPRTPEEWKREILAQKMWVRYFQAETDKLNALQTSVRNGSLPANGPQMSKEAEAEQAQRLEKVQRQLAVEKKKLEDMQEAARQAGMPSTVYDPSRPIRFMKSNAGVLRYMRSQH